MGWGEGGEGEVSFALQSEGSNNFFPLNKGGNKTSQMS